MAYRKHKRVQKTIPLIAVLGLALTLFSSDLYIPSMPAMANDLMASSDIVQLTLGAQLLGISLFGLFLGPLSDFIGRRRVLLSCLGGIVVFALGCALSPNIYSLIAFRFLQGCCASGLVVISMTLIKDFFPTLRSTHLLSQLMMVSVVSPAIAPILGGYISASFGWRSVFFTILGLAISLLAFEWRFLPETNARVRRLKEKPKLKEFSFKKMTRTYKKLLSKKTFVAFGVIHGSLFAGKWCFLAVAPFVFINSLKIPSDIFGYYLAGFAISFLSFHLFVKTLSKRLGNIQLIYMGLLIATLSALAFLLTAVYAPGSPVLLSVTASIYFGVIAWISPSSAVVALTPFKKTRGAASSVIACMRTFLGFGGALAGGLFADINFINVAFFFLATTTVPLFILKAQTLWRDN